jgi:hypothetical protein
MRAEEMITMPRGGHAHSGPPPDPNALRNERSDVLGWKVLPITGRPGDPPDWPLTEATDREMVHWARLWRTPQATEWEKLGQVVEVAIYVRRLVVIELPDATASLGNHVLRLAEGLGLTIPGLLRNRWQIGGGQAPATDVEAPTGTDGPKRAGGSVRGRLLAAVPDAD